jgi:hypothetical protein
MDLPEKLVSARASDMNRSMPTMIPTPSSSSGRWLCSPAASVASPAPLNPDAPLEAIIMKANRPSCSELDNGSPSASAMNADHSNEPVHTWDFTD